MVKDNLLIFNSTNLSQIYNNYFLYRMIKNIFKFIFFIKVIVGVFSILTIIVRNIYLSFFSIIKKPITLIVSLLKKLYRKFIFGKETKIIINWVKKFNLAYITKEDSRNKKEWSGSSYNIYNCLLKTGHNVKRYGP